MNGYWKRAGMMMALCLMLIESGCASAAKQPACDRSAISSPSESAVQDAQPAILEHSGAQESGIQIVSLRLTAAGHMLDLRYRIKDAERASPLFDRQTDVYLIDEATGVKMTVPRMAKVGPLRQTNFNPDPHRVYFILFGNSGGLIRSGSQVTLQMGEREIKNLVVQ